MKVVLALMLTATTVVSCNERKVADLADHAEVCVDQATQLRVRDVQCEPELGRAGGPQWFYVNQHSGTPAPPVGQKIQVSIGTYTRPNGSVARPLETGGFVYIAR